MRISYFLIIALLISSVSCSSEKVSGRLENGYRILDIRMDKSIHQFTVYRGDYIKFSLPEELMNPVVVFPTLREEKPLSHDLASTPFFKMAREGVFPFEIGSLAGRITVLQYQEGHYREFTAREANDFIETRRPVLLDVRTRAEYERGHLENAVLIPVQELQGQIRKLDRFKDEPVLIYCATGNRSTVAAKILIDAGFSQVYNLRNGIAEWEEKKYPITRPVR